MKILITGGTGFIGKNLLLEKFFLKHEVAVLTKKRLSKEFIKINSEIQNIEDKIDKIKKFGPHVLIHLAWGGIPDYGKEMSKKNYLQQIIFFHKLKKITSIKKIIVTGSCFEYGVLKGSAYEAKKIISTNHFSKAKINIYKYLKKNFSKNVKIVWLRLFYVYGKKQRGNALIPYLIKSLKSGKKIHLNEPYAARDFINVKDICKIIFKFLEIKKQGIFNVGTGNAKSPKDIINFILKHTKSKSIISYDKKKKKTKFYANTNKLKSVFFEKLLPLKRGIEELIPDY